MSLPRRTRIINSSRVIRQLWIEEKLSRAELAKRLALNKSSMSSIVNNLIEQQVLLECEEMQVGPKGGRKATGLQLNKDHFFVLGIEIRSDSYTALAVDLEGSILFSETVPKGFTASSFSADITALINDLVGKLLWLTRPLLGVGIGFSGIVESDNQIITRSVSLDFTQPFDFGKEVASQFDFPVILENDANCGAWGEVVFQRKRRLKNFLFVLIEFWKCYSDVDGSAQPTIGIGFGFEGKIYRGNHSMAGEFKSVFNRDAQDNHQIALKKQTDSNYQLADDLEALQAYIKELCSNIAFLVNTLDIGNVFIGGDIGKFRSFMPEILQRELSLNSLEGTGNACQIQFSSLGYQAVSFGAAALVLDKVLMNLEPLGDVSLTQHFPLFFVET
jgi:predicted NBD/HSP70 family sugar kinase